jgi:hypothetical protein
MIDTPVPVENEKNWSQQLQRRIIRLLLLHDKPLFRNQFRQFFVNSELPEIPLLQQYDLYIRLATMSSELLEDIMPRIRRQLSLKTSHARLTEDYPTRGDIDWQRSLERSWSQTPGQPPLQFETRLRQRTLNSPENQFTIAVLKVYQQEIQQALKTGPSDEALTRQEQQTFVAFAEMVERELASAYARTISEQVAKIDPDQLARQVADHLPPGSSPYHDLLDWWQRFRQFRIGRASLEHYLTLSNERNDEKAEAWLYEIWIALEYIHLFQQKGSIQSHDMQVATDLLQCTFTWNERRFRFLYNRQLNTSTSFQSAWSNAPLTRPDYVVEREQPLEITHQGTLIWREPPVLLDAKYYLTGSDPTNTHSPIKKLLGDMTLLNVNQGFLFFPLLPEPAEGQAITRSIKHMGQQYDNAQQEGQQVHLCRLEPAMSLDALQQRLSGILNLAAEALPDRPAPICEGAWLDQDTLNASQRKPFPRAILCPKRHIGPDVMDIVNPDKDCLKNPHLCHVIGQPITPPFVVRVTSQAALTHQSGELRARVDAALAQAENQGKEEEAEAIRQQVFNGVGQTVENYVKLMGNTKEIEKSFDTWAFGNDWRKTHRCLDKASRDALVSGEFVWQNYQGHALEDWAAPAIQYCRALEHELKRRLHLPNYHYRLNSPSFTIGTVTTAYFHHKYDDNWRTFKEIALQSKSSEEELLWMVGRLVKEKVREYRNLLAHGGPVTEQVATSLRDSILGDKNNPGLLHWLVKHLDPEGDRVPR